MKVKWARVWNFRSITDSGEVNLNEDITVLAGRNESGKTNFLRALECFSNGEFNSSDTPHDEDEEVTPRVMLCLEYDMEDLQSYKLDGVLVTEKIELIVNMNNDGNEYSGELFEKLITPVQDEVGQILLHCEKLIMEVEHIVECNQSLYNNFPISYNISLMQDLLKKLKFFSDKLIDEEFILSRINDAENLLGMLRKAQKLHYGRFKILDDILPKFVYLNSFEDVVPENVVISYDVPEIINKIFVAFDTSLESIMNQTNEQRRKALLNRISSEFSQGFSQVFSQHEISFDLGIAGETLSFDIYDKDSHTPFRADQRSKGLQWFLSFFISVSAEAKNNSVVLLDEPGLYLHPKAQVDMLRFLESVSNITNVIISTHSPYLIDPDRLDRVRLVSKDDTNHTVIENKSHRSSDQETMTPIITAIGLDLSRSLTFCNGLNVLVEGITDYYYLQTMRRYLADQISIKDIQFIPSVGASQITHLASLLIGWGLDFKVILDKDKAGKDASDNLKLLDISEENGDIIYVSNKERHAIEDLFSKDDFRAYLLDYHPGIPLNSIAANDPKVKKYVLAKEFSRKVDAGEVTLSQETIDNFLNLFKKLLSGNLQPA